MFLKILSFIENSNINNQLKFHVFTVIFFKSYTNTKGDFVKNRFCVKIPGFSFVFHGAVEKYWEFWPPSCINNIHFPIEQDTEIENQSIISTTYRGHRRKKKKQTHIVKSIRSSFHSESKMLTK